MLYIDASGKRGVYYFTLNLLKNVIRYGNDLSMLMYRISDHAGLANFVDITRLGRLLDLQPSIDLVFIPHPRTYVHALVPYVLDVPINVVIHDVHFLITPRPVIYKLKLLPRYELVAEAVRYKDVHVTTVSQFSKYAIERYLRIPSNRVHVIHPGVDSIFRPIPKDLAISYIRSKYGVRDKYFIYFGAISIHKGIYDLINSFSIGIRRGLRNHKLVLVGPLEINIKELLGIAKSLCVDGLVQYLGWVPRNDMPYLISAATALVMLSRHEGFGLPIVESMACGTPVIATNIPVFKEVLSNAGILVKPNNHEDVAQQMIELSRNEDLRQELRLKSLEKAKYFTWDRAVMEYMNLWRRISWHD
jgi:glycosyltransferase involved in cell wall biosynthesis